MNTRVICLFLMIVSYLPLGVAQTNTPDLGLVVGLSNYLGDIGNGPSPRRPFIYDLQPQETRFTLGAQAIYDFNRVWAIRGGLQYIGIGGDDVHTVYGPRRARNLHFRNNIIEASGRAEWYYRPNQSFSSAGGMPAFYVFGGIGVFYSNPQARQSEAGSSVVGVWQNLRPLQTEDVAYSPIGLALPLGFGAQWRLQDGWLLGVELCYRFTTTDYLDDISTVFKDTPYSSRTTEESLMAGGFDVMHWDCFRYSVHGEPVRGCPEDKDGYGTLQVTLSKHKAKGYGGGKGLRFKRYPRHPAYWNNPPGR